MIINNVRITNCLIHKIVRSLTFLKTALSTKVNHIYRSFTIADFPYTFHSFCQYLLFTIEKSAIVHHTGIHEIGKCYHKETANQRIIEATDYLLRLLRPLLVDDPPKPSHTNGIDGVEAVASPQRPVSEGTLGATIGLKYLRGEAPYRAVTFALLYQTGYDVSIADNDIVVGNPRNYILNETTQLRVDRERTVKGRKTTFGGYAVVDGAPKPGAFAYGQYTPTV